LVILQRALQVLLQICDGKQILDALFLGQNA
jgi:hypothetical protein